MVILVLVSCQNLVTSLVTMSSYQYFVMPLVALVLVLMVVITVVMMNLMRLKQMMTMQYLTTKICDYLYNFQPIAHL